MIDKRERYYYIYMHKNKINNKKYIGCTCQERPERRWKNGKSYKTCTYFNNAIQKYGWDNFEHIIIEEGFFTEKYAGERENYWINHYDTKNPQKGYNITSGGYQDVSPNMLSKALEWIKSHPEFGLERVKAMHKWQKEHCEEAYEFRMNNVKKASESRKRPVVCIETNIVYESASDASRKVNGTTQSKITMCCRGQRKTCGGFHWRYKGEINMNDKVYLTIPSICPICGKLTRVKKDNGIEILVCTNPNCKGKLLGKLTHFCSKNAMDIDGLSEATLEKFIEFGWVNEYKDLYNLSQYKERMMHLEGFGKKSVEKLLKAIEDSRTTTLDRFIYSLSIPLIGRNASKDIANACFGDIEQFITKLDLLSEYAFSELDGFGKEMGKSLNNWWKENKKLFYGLKLNFFFEKPQISSNSNSLSGKTFVITGSVNHFTNRDEVKTKIESMGGKVAGSVSAKTSYLVNNDAESKSSKNQKAKSLGIPIINEDQLLEMMKG